MSYQIAIDGPAASGKSSAAEKVAERLKFQRLDSGMLYRAITYIVYSTFTNPDPESEKVKNMILNIKLEIKNRRIFYNMKDITPYLRTSDIDQKVGVIAKILYIRTKVHEIQNEVIKNAEGGVVIDGRDIGTVVLPNAFLKVFITAKDTTRAKRRSIQTGQNYEEVLEDIKKRDYSDINREHGPLKIAEDAVVIENDDISLDETVDKIVSIFEERKLKKQN